MRIAVILSAGGSHEHASDTQAGRIVEQGFSRAGHEVTIALVEAVAAERAVRAALASDAQVIAVGGSNELVLRATNLVTDTPTALGVLPLGGRSPLGRALRVPADLQRAVVALGHGAVERIDVAEVNGRVFAVQAALGLYPWLLRHRDLLQGGRTRGGRPDVRETIWYAVAQQPVISAYVEYNGLLRAVRTPWLAVANGALSEAPPRGAAELGDDTSQLQLYIGRRRSIAGWVRRLVEVAVAGKLSPDALLGRRSDNPGLEPIETRALVLRSRRRRLLVALDGTVELLDAPLRCHVRRAALKVLKPAV